MEQGKCITSFFLTLVFHGIILFGVKNHIIVKNASLAPSTENVIKMKLLTEMTIPQIKQVIKPKIKPSKIKPKKINKPVAKKMLSKPVPVKPIMTATPDKKLPVVNLQEIEKYALELRAFIEKHKFYPRMAKRLKQSGALQLNIVIGENGKFEEVSMAETSPFPILNNAAMKLINKLGKFKPLPARVAKKSFVIPIRYKL